MLKLKANNNDKQLKDEFIDVTLNELSQAYQYVSGLDFKTKRYLLEDGEDVDNNKLFEFKLHWISLFSDFTIDELRLVSNDEDELLNINWLYKHCKKFLYQPKSYLDLKEFKHKGVTYNIIEPIKTIGGAELLFGNGNYRQFMIGSQLTNMVQENRNQGGIPSLIQLFALLYTDGKDSSDDVIQRAKVFGDVNALYGWSAYFFFARLVQKYSDFFRLSTITNPSHKVKVELAHLMLRRKPSSTFFGKWLQSRLPKREFSVLTV